MHIHMCMYNICRSTQCAYIFYINYILWQFTDHYSSYDTYRERYRHRMIYKKTEVQTEGCLRPPQGSGYLVWNHQHIWGITKSYNIGCSGDSSSYLFGTWYPSLRYLYNYRRGGWFFFSSWLIFLEKFMPHILAWLLAGRKVSFP